jgi:hypothetical protein
MATWVSTQSGAWSDDVANATSPWYGGAGNPATGVPVAGDTVTIVAGDEVLCDVTIGAAGLANLTINSHATSAPGMLVFKDGTSGTVVIADAGHIQGSSTSAVNKGRILANLSGLWTGPVAAASPATLVASQNGTSGSVSAGNVFTPGVSPGWVVDALINESVTVNGTSYVVSDNDATTATLTSGPGALTVTAWALVVRPLPADHTAHLSFLLTAHMPTQYLDVLMYSSEPTTKSVRTYGQVFAECAVSAASDNLTYTGIAAALPNNTLVRVSAGSGALPAELAADTDYWVVGASANTIQLAASSGGGAIGLSAGGPINVHCGLYANWGVTGNTLTKTTHGIANGVAVMVKSTGTLPTPLAANTMYYVVSTAAGAISLALVWGGTALTLGGSPSGTLDVYTGSTGAAPGLGGTNPYTSTIVNVLDNVTGESTTWVGSGTAKTFANCTTLSAAVLADAGPENYDQQRLAIQTIAATTMTLGEAVDSIQYPNARLWLMSRNVRITSTCATAVNIVDGTSNTSGGVFGEIRSIAGTGTTFYGTSINGGTSHTATTISGCSNGISSGTFCTATTISGCECGINYGTSNTTTTISGCKYGIYYSTSHTATTISGCGNGINSGISCTATTISGCGNGINSGISCTATTISGCECGIIRGTSHTATTISGCIEGIVYGTSHTATTISGCYYGIVYGTSHTATTISGCIEGIYGGISHTATTISGCSNGISGSTSCTATTISGCGNGINAGNGTFRETTFYGNTYDIRRPRGVIGYGCSLQSGGANYVYEYKHADESITNANCGISMYNIKTAAGTAQPGYIARWDIGGKTITEAWAAGTHDADAQLNALYGATSPPNGVHATLCEDSDVLHLVEIPLWCAAGQNLTVHIYARLLTAGKFAGQLPRFRLVYPGETDGTSSEFLETWTITDNNDWQTVELNTAARSQDGPIWLRMEAQGGNAGGTGTTDILYWFHVLDLDYPAVADVEDGVFYGHAVYEGEYPTAAQIAAAMWNNTTSSNRTTTA